MLYFVFYDTDYVLQYFDAVGWVAGRAASLYKLSGGMLA